MLLKSFRVESIGVKRIAFGKGVAANLVKKLGAGPASSSFTSEKPPRSGCCFSPLQTFVLDELKPRCRLSVCPRTAVDQLLVRGHYCKRD